MFVSAGFFLMRPHPTRGPAIPGELRFSLSGCLSEFLPDTWCIEWAEDAKENEAEHRLRFSLDRPEHARLVAQVTSGFGERFGWTNVVYDVGIARDLHEQFGRLRGFELVEVGLHQADVAEFVACATPPRSPTGFAPTGEAGVLQKLKRNEAMAPAGRFLGFEPVSFRACIGHSWRCTLEPEKLGSTNSSGLIEDLDHARSMARSLGEGRLPAEPEPYFAWRIHHIAGPLA
jgi:hypothetical protein